MRGRWSKAQWSAATILAVSAAVPAMRLALPASAAPHAAMPAKAAHPISPVLATPVLAVRPASAPASAPTPAAEQALVVRHVIDTHGPIRYGTWFWDAEAATSSAPLTITVDLKASVISVFRGGDEIGTTAIIYGEDGRDTPLGTFPILQKDRHHVSNLYQAPMPYMLRLTRDGISIHASEVAYDYATHGCIGVPAAFAKRLFDQARLGDKVIVTNQGLRAS